MLRIIAAFLRKDLLTAASYRVVFVLGSLSALMTVSGFFYIARLIPPTSPALARYGSSYFPWAIIGITMSTFLAGWLSSLSASLREEQMTGTLEAIMNTPVSPARLIVAMMAWPLLSIGIVTIAYFAIATWLLGALPGGANWMAATVIAVLAFLAFTGLGLMSAAFVLVFKKGDPIALLVAATGEFLCGAFFPVEFLPPWLRHAAQFVPLTPAIEGVRLALLRGATLAQLGPQWQALSLMAAFTVAAGVLSLRAALRYLRVAGGFTHY
jgi:ABC-2 type transport system permease protein